MAFEMDFEDIRRSPATTPSVDLGYSRQSFAAVSVAEFIRHLGYHAIPMGNDTALSIPLAVNAGLGELGRNGLLITPQFGPRVRLSKVFTDLPLETDKPIDIGVQSFCEVCRKCAKHCPAQAISHGDRTANKLTRSTNPGVLKWPVNPEKCIKWWMKNGTWCANCIRVCCYNKPNTRFWHLMHKIALRLVSRKSKMLNKLLVWIDDNLMNC